jgi:16S rRNA (uracil1498-N3)-methyltransferase
MALRRVFVDRVSDGEAHVEGPAAHHLARVVRLREGEEVELSDGRALFRARVAKAGSRRVEFAIEEEMVASASGPDVTLQIAVFQFSRLEWALEKATELGVTRVVPVVATRSEMHLVKAVPKRLERWKRIAEQAAQQSRRMSAPVIEEAVSFEQAVADRKGTGLVLHPDGDLLGDILASCEQGPIQLLVGPEGGWTDDEVSAALAAGYQQAGMGSLILRCETAAVAALSIISQARR